MRPQLRLIRLWYVLGVLLLINVLVGSLVRFDLGPQGVDDKTGHVFAYAVLAGWFGLLAGSRAALCFTGIGLLAYGALIEVLQDFTDYRFAEWGDLMANALGITIGLMLYPTPLRRLFALFDAILAERLKRLGFFSLD